jgi:putative ABC transport system permease protein
MNQIWESVFIALGAIWANKLRSFMTVLGNIVAVTSIVTVVTPIRDERHGVGGDHQRRGRRLLHDPAPAAHPQRGGRRADAQPDPDDGREGDAIRAFSPLVTAVMGRRGGRHGVVSQHRAQSGNVQAVTGE